MKDGTTHLAYKAEHAVYLDTGVVVADVCCAVVTDEGSYYSRKRLKALEDGLWKRRASPDPSRPS
jgi:hypothetical protein